jgi:Nanos RNA binding domain
MAHRFTRNYNNANQKQLKMRSTAQNNQRNRYTKETEQKKYCSVCHKAGKSEKEYTSHFTKSVPGPSGIVVCPTILRNLCNKCNKYGHFSDHCKEIRVDFAAHYRPARKEPIAEKKEEKTYEELWPTIGQVVGSKRVHSGNAYAALEDEAMPAVKPAPHKMNFKKVLETEYVAPKEDEHFLGEMQVLGCKNFKVLTGSAPKVEEYYDNDDWDMEEDWEREDYEAEIDRRLEERYNNYYEDEADNSAW